ncbi:ThiF family adenylyltransferase [Lysobacter korlensis]|uniref:ThiF family adenylyltransferase n=1 Tax=Lysobacter korlensis TaxID=553636 RepID=A0ABV6RZX0_9GAMM
MDAPALPPLVPVGPELSGEEQRRYARQLVLDGIGTDGQRRLKNARVLVVGAGGLGSPVLLYLASAGVGTLGIADGDTVAVSNLQRQVLHPADAVGRGKVDSAVEALAAVNPLVRVVAHPEFLSARNADLILSGYDLVIDGTDNFETRYVLSDAAARAGIPCVWGSVLRYDGQVSVFWDAPPGRPGVTLRDLHPQSSATDSAESCAVAGVLGALCGSVGSVMATEAIKLLVGAGTPLLGRVLVVDALDGTRAEVPFRRAERPAAPPPAPLVPRWSWPQVDELLSSGSPVTLLDVRGADELDPAPLPGSLRVSHDALADPTVTLSGVDPAVPLVVYCRSGARSEFAVRRLSAAGFPRAVSVEGGLLAREG